MQLLTLLLGLVAFASASRAAGVLAIDYGTEWMKVSLLKPGIPFDVLLNTDSKRKIQSVATLKGDDRWIGGEAASLASRYPESTYPNVKLLLGKDGSHQHVSLYESLYRIKLHSNTTSNRIQYNDPKLLGEEASSAAILNHPEEYLAMQLSYAKKLAKSAVGELVVDTVVTVPNFFTHAERLAMLDAIELAGLKPLALIDDGSAVAINYAMTRTFPSEAPEYHLFYDAGAGSIQATVVALQTKEVKDDPASKLLKNVTAVDIKGLGWDLSAGGIHMDGRIRDILELQYITGDGRHLQMPFAENKRAQAKLMKEANRVKQVLSANDQSPSRVEGLAEDVDFSGSLTRQAFEAACQDMKPAFTKPIDNALKAAGLSIDDLASVVLVGGTSRVPMVQDAVSALVGTDKVTKNLNADEAAVMGAALYGARLSRQYKTKDIRLTGMNPYAIDVSYTAAGGAGSRVISSTLFPANSKLGVQKTMTLRQTADFDLSFKDKATSRKLADYQITGLTTAYANLTDIEKQNATVTVSVLLSDSNLLNVENAQLNLHESKESASVADKIKGFFGAKDKEKTEGGEGDGDESSKASDDSAIQAKPRGPIKLSITEVPGYFKPMSEPEKKDSIKRLRDIDLAETRKRDREEARNALEAYTYRLRDQLESPAFIEASTEAERVQIRKKLEEASEWMWDQADSAATKDLRSAKSELERVASAPNTRIREAAGRADATKDFRIGLVQAQAFLVTASEQLKKDSTADEPSKYTETELKTLETSILSAEKWLDEMSKKQDSLEKNVDPVMKIAELDRRRKDLASQVAVLQMKRAPKKPKKATTASSSNGAASESSATPVTTPESSPAATPTTTLPARDEL